MNLRRVIQCANVADNNIFPRGVLLSFFLFGISPSVLAQAAPPAPVPPPTPAPAASPTINWSDVGFGVGLAVTRPTSKRAFVQSAELDQNNVVRATEEHPVSGRVILEMHCFACGFSKQVSKSWSPFVAIATGGDSQVLDGVGYGIMWGFKRPANKEGDATKYNSSFNVGLGMMHEFNVRELADGISVNEPLPAGQTQITYKTTTRTSYLLLFSFSWE